MYTTEEIEETCRRRGWRFLFAREWNGYDAQGNSIHHDVPVTGGLGVVMTADFQRELGKFRCVKGGENATWEREGPNRRASVATMVDRLDI